MPEAAHRELIAEIPDRRLPVNIQICIFLRRWPEGRERRQSIGNNHAVTQHRDDGTHAGTLSKVPKITLSFWVTKILTTGMGETTSDFLVRTFDPPPVVTIVGALLAVLLAWQVLSRSYSAWRYWGVVVLISIFGTMVADTIHVVAGVPYVASTFAFGLALTAVLTLWQRSEGTLSIHTINTRNRETFYWPTVLATFALGTAGGDLTASSLGLGYWLSGVIFALLFVLPFTARKIGLTGEIGAFWTAYIITRPLGASFADWVGVTKARGGLDWGMGWVSLALGVLILVMLSLPQRRSELAS